MTLKASFQSLRSTLPRYTPELVRAAARDARLAPFVDPASVLWALRPASRLSDEQRDGIVGALITEKQSSPHPLWSTMLILAFEPAIRRLRSRLKAGGSEEAEQTVIFALLEAAETVPVDGASVALNVQRAMARNAFRSLRALRNQGTRVPLDEMLDEDLPEVSWRIDQSAFVRCAVREILRASAGGPGEAETLVAGAGVVTTPERFSPEQAALPPREKKRVHSRIRQRSRRAVARLRKTLDVA